MEKQLVDHILAQHAEADAFEAEAPGNWMGRLPGPEQTAYWADREKWQLLGISAERN